MHSYLFLLIAQVPPGIETGGNDQELLKRFILEENGQNRREEGFLSPSGRFRVKIPNNFQQQDDKDPDTLSWMGDLGNGVPMQLIIRRVTVTPGSSPGSLLLTTRDRFQSMLPGFAVLKQQSVKIAGRSCAWMLAHYDYQGHRGFPQVIENAYIVDGGDGFIIHSEVAETDYQAAAPVLGEVYKSFRTIAPAPDKPEAPPPEKPVKGKKKKS